MLGQACRSSQVPVLFTGTLRFNLTPFGEHSDAECWAALRRAHLASVVEASPFGLDLVLSEGGAPFSAGQKQLVALARALLRHSRVCILTPNTGFIGSTGTKEFSEQQRCIGCSNLLRVLLVVYGNTSAVHSLLARATSSLQGFPARASIVIPSDEPQAI